MILSFACVFTEEFFRTGKTRHFHAIAKVALRKLDQLQIAGELSDLAVPPGNRLEALSSDRKGQHSISINDQWRVCFTWQDGHATQVAIVDYH
ncbi:MAG: type II toxin-antitoxin system RelE/ParE family toxin [Deltaproteobacteria bacterium]|jgi:proteic killer suppression protein|nr:type II toxin-antitoxin system RelE/ParE family toxin [Deltaproteobacteria bacterium]